jgi:hypothetical protein
MAYEKMERAFGCPCGNGEMIAEWAEHDTWPSPNRSIQWSFACPNCDVEYQFYGHLGVPHTVRKGDAEKHSELVRQHRAANRELCEVASARYEQRWVDYVLSFKTKAAMHRAIRPYITAATFSRHAKREGWVEREARSRFQVAPNDCLEHLGIYDAEVAELAAVAEMREKEAGAFWDSIDKTPVPFR